MRQIENPMDPAVWTPKTFFFFVCFLANQQFIYRNFLLCHPSQRSARSQVTSQVAIQQEIAVSCGLGRRLTRTRDCRTTVWHAIIEPLRFPIEPPCFPQNNSEHITSHLGGWEHTWRLMPWGGGHTVWSGGGEQHWGTKMFGMFTCLHACLLM
jgi:hypothetical protein